MAQENSTPAVSLGDEDRIWLSSWDAYSGRRALLHVRYQDTQPASAEVVFECEIRAESDLGPIVAEMGVLDDNGMLVQEGRLDLAAAQGVSTFRFTMDAASLPPGDYAVELAIMEPRGQDLAWQVLDLRKLTRTGIQSQVSEALALLDALKRHIAWTNAQSPYIRMKLALAEDSLAYARTLTDDWRRIQHMTRYAVKSLNSLRARMAFGALHADSLPNTGEGAGSPQGRPAFLVGVRGPVDNADDIARIGRYGLSLIVLDRNDAWLDGVGAPRPEALDPLLEAAAKAGLAVAYFHGKPRVFAPPADRPLYDDPAVAYEEAARGLAETAAYFAGKPRMLALGLAVEPRYLFGGEAVRTDFVEHIRGAYKDRYTLNRTWGTRFLDLNEMAIWANYSRPTYQYDWQNYHRGLVTRHFNRLIETAHGAAPDLPLQITFDGAVLEPGETQYGFDYEALLARLDVGGLSIEGTWNDPVYAVPFPHRSLVYTLWKSLAPDKPLFNAESPAIGYPGAPPGDLYDRVYASMWEAAMDGVNAMALWTAGFFPGDGHGVLDWPEAVEALATAGLDLNRFGEIIGAFQRAPADLGVLWSDSSRLINAGDPYLRSVLSAYEGASFAGLKVRFVTEAQCVRGDLAGLKVLVIPNMPALSEEAFNAVQARADAGGMVVKAATPIPYDAKGESRSGTISYGANTILVRGGDDAPEYLNAIDAAITLLDLHDVPRIVNEFGYPVEGVRGRYVALDGRGVLYVVNIRKQPVRVRVQDGPEEGVDLLTGREVRFPMTLRPLRPMLIQFDSPQPSAPLEPLDAPDTPAAVPTARIGPVAK